MKGKMIVLKVKKFFVIILSLISIMQISGQVTAIENADSCIFVKQKGYLASVKDDLFYCFDSTADEFLSSKSPLHQNFSLVSVAGHTFEKVAKDYLNYCHFSKEFFEDATGIITENVFRLKFKSRSGADVELNFHNGRQGDNIEKKLFCWIDAIARQAELTKAPARRRNFVFVAIDRQFFKDIAQRYLNSSHFEGYADENFLCISFKNQFKEDIELRFYNGRP